MDIARKFNIFFLGNWYLLFIFPFFVGLNDNHNSQLKGGFKNGTENSQSERASKMFNRDCQLMGLTWLLARNKTAYIPTVSAVLRAIMYSAHPPHQSRCSPDQENMPLAVDSLQFEKAQASSSLSTFLFPFLPLIILVSLFA